MPNSSDLRSAGPWLRDPTATATPESVSRRSVTNVLAIPPVPRIPHRTGLSATSPPPPPGMGDHHKGRGRLVAVHLLAEALVAALETQVTTGRQVRASQLPLPSACPGWSVREVLNHSIGVPLDKI